MKDKKTKKKYTQVWGDIVSLNELVIAAIIGIVVTMGMYFLGQYIFNELIVGIDEALANGYALLIGVSGVFISGFISAKLFKPKRKIEEKMESEAIEDVLKAAGITLEEEAAALAEASPEIIEEMEDLELYGLLALIPEGSKNYKPEYKKKLEGEK